jgi:hypothetical protein
MVSMDTDKSLDGISNSTIILVIPHDRKFHKSPTQHPNQVLIFEDSIIITEVHLRVQSG